MRSSRSVPGWVSAFLGVGVGLGLAWLVYRLLLLASVGGPQGLTDLLRQSGDDVASGQQACYVYLAAEKGIGDDDKVRSRTSSHRRAR